MKLYKQEWFVGCILLLASLLLFFGSIEAILRLAGIDRGVPKTPPIYRKSDDPALSYQLKPHLREVAFRSTVVTDHRGFRSDNVHPGKPTVAILGDSIAFGYGLENDQTLSARLDMLLEKKLNIVNAAVPGYGINQEAAMYARNVDVLHPSTLILVFHWNDLTITKPSILDDEGNLLPPGSMPDQSKCHPIEDGMMKWIPARCWLDLHSAFYRTVKKIINARTGRRYLEIDTQSSRNNAFHDGVTDAQLQSYENALRGFATTLPRSLRRLFVIWPDRQLRLLTTGKLGSIAARQGFSVLNLYEVFGNQPESLGWDSVHPSRKTIDAAAAVITAALKEWELLP